MIKIKAFHFSFSALNLDTFHKAFPLLQVSCLSVCDGYLVIIADNVIDENATEFYIGKCNENKLSYGLTMSIVGLKLLLRTDWLATVPLYFDGNDNSIASSWVGFNERKYELDIEGFHEYAIRGYSPGVKTAYKDMTLIRHNTVVTYHHSEVSIEKNDDILEFVGETDPDTVLQKLKYASNTAQGDLIVPLSGGLDSRMLLGLLNTTKASCWTYSVSKYPGEGIEEVKAKYAAEKLGFDWNLLTPNSYLDHIDRLAEFYGPIMHYHGMYQFDFYSKIHEITSGEVLSGVFGDIFARKWPETKLSSWEDSQRFSYNHGRAIDLKFLKNLPDYGKARYIKPDDYAITLVREKMSLIGYLRSLPEYIGGFAVNCPFLDKDVAMSIIRLADDEKDSRRWQKNFVRKMGLESNELSFRKENYLAIKEELFFIPKLPENLDVLSEVLESDCIEMIKGLNRVAFKDKLYAMVSSNYYGARALKKLGYNNKRMRALNMYFTLAPILRNLR